MKMKLTAVALALSATALYADTPIQLSLTPDIALYPKDTMVKGFSLNIWGENPQQSLHIGFVNGSTGDSAGLSWGLVNYAESFSGVQLGWFNFSSDHFVGVQDGWVNISQGTFEGLQYGLVNVSDDTAGLQLGVVNYAKNLHGVQLGLLNIAMNNPAFSDFPDKLAPGFPFLNWSF